MPARLVDLSMPVDNDMVTFPGVAKPDIHMNQTWQEFAENIGAAQYGATWLTATCSVQLNDHAGTHLDTLRHMRDDVGGAETIPIEYCYADGVVLDFRHTAKGDGITAADVQAELCRIDYRLKPLDIVLIMTGAGEYQGEERYLTDHSGMTRDSTMWLIDQGIKVMGIDAVTFDPPVWAMFERKQFWEAHMVMREREYYHLENLTNLDKIGRPHGFKLSVFPIKWVNTTGAPVRAVAIVDD